MKISRKPNTDEIQKAVNDNNGFCPCKTVKNNDTKCMCKEFIDQKVMGECHCGLFEKTEGE